MKRIFEKFFGTHSEREIKKIEPIINKIEALDETMQKLMINYERSHKSPVASAQSFNRQFA